MAIDLALRVLVSPEDCKETLEFDDRDDAFCRFLLVISTATVESYLNRRILRRGFTEYFDSSGRNALPLKEYPLRQIESVHEDRARRFPETSLIEAEHYYAIPDPENGEDLPGSLILIPPYRLPRGEKSIRVRYFAGYEVEEVPADLKAAVIELVAWNFRRYREGRLGGGHPEGSLSTDTLERSLPEQVRLLLESYRRRTL